MHKEAHIISVIIVTYNAEQFLQRCLDSIYKQACKAISIIVIDGGSNDRTVALLKENHQHISYWKSEPDKGIYDAMNKGLLQVHTPWVYFLGADDVLLPDFSALITTLEDPHLIYYGNVLYKGKKCSGKISPYRQAKLGIFHQSIIYPSGIFQKYNYDTRYPIAADYALNMKLHKDPDYTFQYEDYLIANYNDTGVSANTKDNSFERCKSKMILHNFGIRIWSRYIFRRLKAALTNKKN